MIIVIADDITGAAEIAGIALKHGLDTVLTTKLSIPPIEPEVLVFATDTRSGSEAKADKTMRMLAGVIAEIGSRPIIFKKTDSVLRGHIITELSALMSALRFENSLLLPQNPSKGRIVRNGTYFINGVELDKTDFNRDPEFPAHSASVKKLLRDKADILGLNTPMERGKIFIADSDNAEEIRIQLNKSNDKSLLAGGADLFTVLLQHKFGKKSSVQNRANIPVPDRAIIICGSTQSKKITEEPFIKEIGAHEEIMPYSVFNGAPYEQWTEQLSTTYKEHKSLIVSIGEKENGGKECAIRLRNIMAVAVHKLVNEEQPELIIIEGGATAYAILSSIGWNSFKLKNEYAPGIVSMTYGKTEIILKPGSYPWGDLFKTK